MDELNNLSMDLTVMIMPWIAILISLVIAIWFKEFATGLAKGLKFKMNKAFNAGDRVLLDGQDAVIVSIVAGKNSVLLFIFLLQYYLFLIYYLNIEKLNLK